MCLYVLLYVYKPYKSLNNVLYCVLFAFLGAIMNFEYYFDKILDFYNVSTIKELGLAIDTGASTISNWKQRNSITALKKRCRELGIYNEIFGDLNTEIQQITTISGGQNAQNVHGNQIQTEKYIENQNILSQNLKIDLIYSKEGVLSNAKELFVNLHNLTINHNFYFEIICENYLNESFYNDISLTLKKNVITQLKSSNWKEKNINDFIKGVYKESSFYWFDIIERHVSEDYFVNILTEYLLKEKIKNNCMPNLNDFNLALNFYKENEDFDFIKIFDYDFERIYNLNKLISQFELKYNSTFLNSYLEDIKNHNALVLENFFYSNESKYWDYDFLIEWLNNNNIKSNLIDNSASTISDLFNLALGDGYFKEEDMNFWNELQNRFISENSSSGCQ